ncbi:hypothetical protein EDB86DRAFT_2825267 [Lactarius hatsudake]|nr:hypothetical protein EDB86DRAFT_2825267 [Lactarius hatsudake]
MLQVHPIIQAVGAEWKTASDAKRRFNWTVLTTSYIPQLCETIRKEHPEWHASLSSLTLDSYLDGLHPTKLWWLEGHPAALPGKRAVNVQVADLPSAPSKPPYALRGTKRRADPDNPEGESDSTTPQKSDLPWVEVEQASPPQPTEWQCTEASATIAYEQDRCGPCALANEVECQAQSNSCSFSCVRCASKHKSSGVGSPVCLWIAVANCLGEALLLEDVVAQWDVRPQWDV